MNNLIEKIITITKPENLNPEDKKPIKFQDENGDKYTLWKTNKEGESVAYSFFKNLPYGGEGKTVLIAYAEEQKSFQNEQGKIINYTERTVRVMKEALNTPPSVQNAQNKQYSGNSPENAYKPISGDIPGDRERGMTRCKIAEAFIEAGTNINLTDEIALKMSVWVEWVMTGKLPSSKPLEEKTVDEIFTDENGSHVEDIN